MNNDYASIFSGILRENQIKTNEPMKRHTTFGIGGPADCFLMPETTEEVCLITKLAHKHAVPLFVLGGGANLLVRDKGIRGAVVFTGRLHRMERKENLLTVASGVPTAAAARKALEYGLSGMEFASGIPGSIGGAAYMNAGAYGGEMAKIIVSATTCDAKGDIIVHSIKDMGYGYRQSPFMQNGEVILDITLSLKPGNQKDIEALMKDLNQRRATKQPLENEAPDPPSSVPMVILSDRCSKNWDSKDFRWAMHRSARNTPVSSSIMAVPPAKICSLSSIRCSRRSKRPMAWICIPRFRS